MSDLITISRDHAEVILETLEAKAKLQVRRGATEGWASRGVINAVYGYPRMVEAGYRTRTRFYMNGCPYSREELLKLLTSSYVVNNAK